ncbi:MAG: ABC transporter permease [Clostridia bacterium]|nr:ABC transporter permease [Clostridia bacterium]
MQTDRTMKWLGVGFLAIAVLSPRFFIIRPNRIVDGLLLGSQQALEGIYLWMLALCILMLASTFIKNRLVAGFAGIIAAAVALSILLFRATLISDNLLTYQFSDNMAVMNPTLSLSMGFYLMATGLFFVMRASLLDLMQKRWNANIFSISIFVLFGVFLAKAGHLDHISIYVEMSRNWDTIWYELGRHLKLSLLSALTGLVISVGLGLWAYRFEKFESTIFKIINFAQVVPTLSLLALFMIPLTYLSNHFQWIKSLGISGIGFAPAFIVLVLYSLLPITSNILTSLKSTQREIMESARGMGMTENQILWKVQFPLSVKPIFAGFRLATLQAIGNCILAGLIGGGGLGSLIFLGLAQSAPDMVLGASLMVVSVAAFADLLLRGGEYLISLKYRGSYD